MVDEVEVAIEAVEIPKLVKCNLKPFVDTELPLPRKITTVMHARPICFRWNKRCAIAGFHCHRRQASARKIRRMYGGSGRYNFFCDHLVHRENGLVVVGDAVLQVPLHVDLALV